MRVRLKFYHSLPNQQWGFIAERATAAVQDDERGLLLGAHSWYAAIGSDAVGGNGLPWPTP
jgi:hypothetical protein